MKTVTLARALYRTICEDCRGGHYDPRCPKCNYADLLASDNMAHCPIHGHWLYQGLSSRDRVYLALECERALNRLPVQEIDNQRAAAILENLKRVLASGEIRTTNAAVLVLRWVEGEEVHSYQDTY